MDATDRSLAGKPPAASRRWVTAAVLAAATCFPLADFWFCVAPPWPEHAPVVLGTVPLPVLVFLAASVVLRGRGRARLERALLLTLIALAVTAVGYVVLSNLFVHLLPDRWHRDVGGWQYNERAQIIREMNPGITLEGLLERSDNKMTLVFEPASVGLARALLLILWYLSAGEASLLVALILQLAQMPTVGGLRVPAGFALEPLAAKVRALQAAFPDYSKDLGHAYDDIHEDLTNTLTKSRRILEGLLVKLYKEEMAAEPRKRLIGDLLADNQFTRKLGSGEEERDELLRRMHTVREWGNAGPHPKQATSTDAAWVLFQVCTLLEWYQDRERRKGRAP